MTHIKKNAQLNQIWPLGVCVFAFGGQIKFTSKQEKTSNLYLGDLKQKPPYQS